MADDILTGVTLHRDVFGDARYHLLAQLCGHANHWESIARMAQLWSICTALETNVPPRAKIVVCLGKAGPEAIVEADLGEVLEDGQIRVKGCDGRTEWYPAQKQRGAAGGAARAAAAPRGERGRFAASADQQTTSESPATTSDHQPATSVDQPKIKSKDQGNPDCEDEPPVGETQPRARTRARSTPTAVPDGWEPDWKQPQLAAARGKAHGRGVDIDATVIAFVAHAVAKDWRMSNWSAGLAKWLATQRPPSAEERAARDEADRSRRDIERRREARDAPPEPEPNAVPMTDEEKAELADLALRLAHTNNPDTVRDLEAARGRKAG